MTFVATVVQKVIDGKTKKGLASSFFERLYQFGYDKTPSLPTEGRKSIHIFTRASFIKLPEDRSAPVSLMLANPYLDHHGGHRNRRCPLYGGH